MSGFIGDHGMAVMSTGGGHLLRHRRRQRSGRDDAGRRAVDPLDATRRAAGCGTVCNELAQVMGSASCSTSACCRCARPCTAPGASASHRPALRRERGQVAARPRRDRRRARGDAGASPWRRRHHRRGHRQDRRHRRPAHAASAAPASSMLVGDSLPTLGAGVCVWESRAGSSRSPTPRTCPGQGPNGVRRIVSVKLLEKEMPAPDGWVLVHVGFAMANIDEEEARLTRGDGEARRGLPRSLR